MAATNQSESDYLTQQSRRRDLPLYQRAEFAWRLKALRPTLSREALSEIGRLGEKTLYRVQQIMRRGSDDTKEQLRRGTMTIRHAYTNLDTNGTEATVPAVTPEPVRELPALPVTPPAEPKTKATKLYGNADVTQELIAQIDRLGDGQCRTAQEIERMTGISRARRLLDRMRLCPWLTITESDEGYTLTINRELRAICDWMTRTTEYGEAPDNSNHPTIPATVGVPVRVFVDGILAEITQKRKENNDLYRMRHWRSVHIDNRKQSVLLDWIEEQLRRCK